MSTLVRTVTGRLLLAGAVVLGVLAPVVGAGPASAAPVASGHLDWGVKASFRSYITGPIAQGSISTADGATVQGDGTFRFPAGDGGERTSASSVTAVLDGAVHFTGHGGQLDLLLSDVQVTIDGTTGGLRADVESRELGSSEVQTFDDVAFATLAPSGAGSVAGATTTWAAVPVTLTAAGAEAFAGFYQAGTAFDPLTLVVTHNTTTTTSSTSSTSSMTSSSTSSTTSSSSTSTSTLSTSTTSSTTSTTAPPTSTTAPVGAGDVVGGRIDWGMKQSFRGYVLGPVAHGSIDAVAPATANADGTYRFPVADEGGAYQSSTSAEADLAGALHFSGHDGELDLTLSDLAVELDGTTGVLRADVASLPLDAEVPEELDDVALVDLDLDAVTPSAVGQTVTWTAVPTTLASEGADAFAGFYTAGTAFDPVTIVLEVEGDVGPLPTTPTSTGAAVTTSAASVRAGDLLTVSGGGFQAGEQVQVFVHSTPRFVGVVTASADGNVVHTFTVPADLQAGTHKVELRGASSGRSIFSADLAVTAGGTSLPRTGGTNRPLVQVAVVLVALGGALELGGRARRVSRRPARS